MIHDQFLLGDQGRQIESHGSNVVTKFLASLFEGHEDAGLAELRSASHQELHRKDGLSTASTATEQTWPSLGQTTLGNLVQPGNTGCALGDARLCCSFDLSPCHLLPPLPP